jgi:hypothetical protein
MINPMMRVSSATKFEEIEHVEVGLVADQHEFDGAAEAAAERC